MITGSWTRWSSRRRIRAAGPRRVALRPGRLLSLKGLGILVATVLLLWLGWLWFRSSSFVSVRTVTVTGLSGPQAGQIGRTLAGTAETMSTLDFSVSKLEQSVQRYPYVRSLSVSTHFPHGATIQVFEQVPIATISVDGRTVAVDAAGALLQPSASPHGALPVVQLRLAPGGGRVTASGAREALAVLAAAPYGVLAHIDNATSSVKHGVIVQMHNGPQLFFGAPTQLHDKWIAATAVLGQPNAAGAQYIDVTDPQRPAAGAASPSTSSATTTSTASASSASTGSASTSSPLTGSTQQPASTQQTSDSQPQVQG